MFSDIDGEFDNEMLSCFDSTNTLSSCSFDIDSFFDDQTETCNEPLGRTEAFTDNLGRTQACTHAHACSNPSGPDKPHRHTCIHVHTQILPTPNEAPFNTDDDTAESVDRKAKKKPLGNREAVRKYREKKKARAASLEDEVVRLRALNQQLMKRLQGRALLEAELARLKCLLVDVRGRIEGELGSFPYQKPTKSGGDEYSNIANAANISGTYVMNPCNDQLHCHGSGTALNGGRRGVGDCGSDDLQCLGNQKSEVKGLTRRGLVSNADVVSGGT